MAVTAVLKGGLGNMLFQLAAAHRLAAAHGQETRSYSGAWECVTPHRHDYGSSVFSPFPEAGQEELVGVPVHHERSFAYYELPDPARAGMVLSGYFQSYRHVTDDFCSLVRGTLPVGNSECRFIHVRRGDYLSLSHVHPVMGADYFNAAVDSMGHEHVYLVFGDDREWIAGLVTSLVARGIRAHDWSQLGEEPTLAAMASSGGGIISNSTFGWWGARLSGSLHVIYPGNWFADGKSASDICDPRWTKL